MKKTLETGERQSLPVRVVAKVPTLNGNDPVAEFTLQLSLKKRARKSASNPS